jgi:hypothetical protein
VLPPDIDPEEVVSINDGYILGGILSCEDFRYFKFTKETLQDAIEWLKDNGWEYDTEELLAELAPQLARSDLLGFLNYRIMKLARKTHPAVFPVLH